MVKVNAELLGRFLLERGWSIEDGHWLDPRGVLWAMGSDGLLSILGGNQVFTNAPKECCAEAFAYKWLACDLGQVISDIVKESLK